MPPRVILGDRGGQYDLWVSKPGVDVTTAPFGSLLMGGVSGVLQPIHADKVRLTNGPGLTAGQRDYTVALPGDFAGLSNLYVWGRLYSTSDGDGNNIRTFNDWIKGGEGDGAFRVLNGQMIVTSFLNITLGTSANPVYLWCHFIIFKAVY